MSPTPDLPIRTYHVTEAVTAYETYIVRASSKEEAGAIIRDPAKRAATRSFPDGHGDDSIVIDVREAPDGR